MDRRAFLGSLALGILGVPRVGAGQPARKGYRIGILGSSGMISDMVGRSPGTRKSSRSCADCTSSATYTESIS